MAIVRGPFSVRWGSNNIVDVEELGFNFEIESNDYTTIDGRKHKIEGAITSSIEVTLLSTDVKALSTLLPQYYVANAAQMSTGETVNDTNGAIDILAAKCDASQTRYNLDVTSCNGEVTRLVNARPVISGIEFADNAVRKVTISFEAEPDAGKGSVQFFKAGALG